jgi:hypothetical protein
VLREPVVARIIEDRGAYYYRPDGDPAAPWSCHYPSRAQAMRAAYAYGGYTHAVGPGTYWLGVRRIPKRLRGWGTYVPKPSL